MAKRKRHAPGEGSATIDFRKPAYAAAAAAFMRLRDRIIAGNFPGFEPDNSDVLARALIDADPEPGEQIKAGGTD